MATGVENPSQAAPANAVPPSPQYAVPTTGQTVTVANAPQQLVNVVIEPAAGLAALTIAYPSAPRDGQTVAIQCTQAVTTLTVTGATLVGGAPAALTALQVLRYVYVLAQNKWYPT